MTARAGNPARRPGPAWDTPAPVQAGQFALVSMGLLLACPALVLTGMRLLPPSDDGAALIASFIPYAIPLLAVALALLGGALLRARRRPFLATVIGIVALALGLQLAWQLPYFVPDRRPVAGATLSLLSLNAFMGEADPGQLRAAAARADVVVLAEVTPGLIATLDQQGWRDRFPYDAGASGGPVANTVVFSRYPLSDSRQFGSSSFNQWVTDVEVPSFGPVALLAVHPCNPFCGGRRWAVEHAELTRTVRQEMGRPLIVAGDFNAVVDHGPMQDLHRLGLRSAVDLAGAGWEPTYPANRLLPPLLAIDHVLVDPTLAVSSFARVPVTGTDHLGLLVTIGAAS